MLSIEKLKQLLFTPITAIQLAAFRIVFGFFAVIEILYLYHVHFIEDYLLKPQYLFNYHFLPLSPFGEFVMQVLLFVSLVCAILILIGKFYRIAITGFFVLFSYFFLLEKTIYNNHLYLIALLAFLLIFIPADQALTIGKPKKKKVVFNWHLIIIQLQFFIVYFFGGVAKLNKDWLIDLQPAKVILASKGIASEFLIYFVSYGGALFDLIIGFLLLYKPTRKIAAIGVLVFSFSNHLLFDDINIFPFFMVCSLVVFLDLSKVKFLKNFNLIQKESSDKTAQRKIMLALGVYLLIQSILPLRHYFIPSDTDWTGEGQRFAWRMKIQSRKVLELEYAIFDLDKKVIYPVALDKHIHKYQEYQMTSYPKMLLDFAHYLGEAAKKKSGLKNVMVKAKVKVSFNGREPQYIFSPDLDLLTVKWNNFGHNEWILPLNE